MDVTSYVTTLRDGLTAAAAAGDEQTQRTAALLGAAIEPAARLAIMDALSELAAEVTEALGDRVVEVRLDGREVRVAVSEPPAAVPGQQGAFSAPRPGASDLGGDISRMTVRLVEQMKGQAERAAAAQGMSLNAWVSQAVQGALGTPGRGGWGRAEESRPGSDGDSAKGGGPGGGGAGDGGGGDTRRVRGWVQG